MRLPRWAVLVLGSFLFACASLVPFLLPGRRDAIKAPHERHKKADLECISCHETIFDSTSLDSSNLPKEKKCLECHKEEKPKGDCGFCHALADAPATYAKVERTLQMDHAKHLERVEEDCGRCHTRLPEPMRTDFMAPKMESCFACHEHQKEYDEGRCSPCHKDLQKYPLRPVAAYSHQGNFARDHRLAAQDGRSCAQCHEQTFCGECHSKTESIRPEFRYPELVNRGFIHRGDFEGRHSVEARADAALCSRCHGVQFCQDCHQRRGLSPGGEASVRPHPVGYSDPASAAFHGADARRDIVSCAACHDQGAASNCVTCHRVGGVGGTPHTPSWLLRHSRDEIARNAMCQACHP